MFDLLIDFGSNNNTLTKRFNSSFGDYSWFSDDSFSYYFWFGSVSLGDDFRFGGNVLCVDTGSFILCIGELDLAGGCYGGGLLE